MLFSFYNPMSHWNKISCRWFLQIIGWQITKYPFFLWFDTISMNIWNMMYSSGTIRRRWTGSWRILRFVNLLMYVWTTLYIIQFEMSSTWEYYVQRVIKWTIKLKVYNVSEAFRKIIYIIRLFFTNKLSKSHKLCKLKSTL